MLAVARVLGELLERYVRSSIDGNRDCRLLIPGLTRNIARELHDYLLKNGVNSYLVIGEGEEPSEREKLIRAAGLTSKRIGTFVAVASPGQLVHIQDSIRGSGGAIRSPAFSEEWPWIDDGSEQFRFDGPVLDCLVNRWSSDPEKQGWLHEFTLDGLIRYTKTSSRRTQLLLEDILGTFDASLYPEIEDVREKLLFHAGVPRPFGGVPPVAKLIQSSARLCHSVIERCQKDEDVRAQARDMVLEVAPAGEQDGIRLSVDCLMDGVGRSTTTDLGLLAFHSCWGQDRSDSTNWRRLDANRLAELFNIKERKKTEITYDVSCDRAVIDSNRKKLASFVGEEVTLDVSYRIPEDQFSAHTWELRILNRRKVVARQALHDAQGELRLPFDTAKSTVRYSRKIPVRLALFADEDVVADERLEMHLCGEDRPAFVVVEPGFDVVDATTNEVDEVPDRKIAVDDPVHLYMFNYAITDVAMYDEDDTVLDVIETGMPGIWRSGQRVDVSAEPRGQLIRICRFEDSSAVLCFEAKDLVKGQFTLEDELRGMLRDSRSSETRLRELADLFAGTRREPYLVLGQIDAAARRRIAIANLMTSRIGWRPLLTNLLEPGVQAAGSLGDFANYLGQVDGDVFKSLSLPGDALSLLNTYSDARDAVRGEIESRLDSKGLNLEHPVYASHPIFSDNRSRQTEQLLIDYVGAFNGILEYLEKNEGDLEWLQLFVLTHLDCAVHWDSSRLRSALFLVGPWHPLVIAKRFMVQAALFSRTQRLLHEQNGKAFRHLASLLGRVQGFRWLLGLSADDRLLEPVYASMTSDPGWHLAFKTNCPSLATEEGIGGLAGICGRLRDNFGLAMELVAGESENLAVTCLSNYMRAFPSRRSIGIRARRGYDAASIVRAVDKHLHSDEGPTEHGRQLPGGVRLCFEDLVGDTGDAEWTNPPLQIYRYLNDAECVRDEHPDIYMLAPLNDLSFKAGREGHKVPRGVGREAVFAVPLNWLTEGQALVPKSITYEFDRYAIPSGGIGGAFTRAAAKVAEILGDSLVTVRSVDLPQRLDAPWVVIPGEGVDPAVLVKYVRDGADRAIQERALWDYKLDIATKETSFFVLSTIPRGFQVAVNGFFGRDEIAGSFIVELGRIGIAIGGEALKSGRHALGVVGLVGAVRLFQGTGSTERAPLACTAKTVGFLVPVESFASFFGKTDSSRSVAEGKRTDLLAIRIALPGSDSGNMRISCCGIECKFTSGTFGITRAHAALDQARATAGEFKDLVETSLRGGAMPERLALAEILKFGLRITGPSRPAEIQQWVNREAAIYDAVLSGNYEYSDAKHNAVLVSTERQLPGVTEQVVLQEGLWVRLTKGHWPGVSDTPQLDLVRRELSGLFGICIESLSTPEGGAPSTADTQPPRRVESGEVPPEVPPLTQQPVHAPEPVTGIHVRQEEGGRGDERTSETIGGPLHRILVGVDEGRRAVYYNPQSPVDPLDNMNLMVTGSSGTGKTQFLKYLICMLREQEKNVLVLDFKNDFASDSTFAERSALDRVFVTFDGLPYNPLIPYPVRHPATGELYVQCGQHIAGVASVLRQTYGLGAQQQAAVKNAIVAAFTAANISTSGSARYAEDMHFPDFSHLGNTLQRDNPSAYNRLDPLFTLGLFRDQFRDSSFKALVGRSAILDLSQIPSDAIKDTLAQLVVLSAHAYYNGQPHSGTIRQVLVFDEAHRVLNSAYMLRLVRECRAYGVATVLSSQYPSDFPGEISASLATKVIYDNGRDSERVKNIVQLIGCEGKEGDVANLERFQAFVDNRQYPHTLFRTMNYPMFLVWTRLQELQTATREELSQSEGVDTSKLPIGNIVRQLERLGLAEEREGRVYLLGRA